MPKSPTSPVITEINRLIEKHGTQSAVASELHISPSLLTEILKGRRGISDGLLDKLGFVKIVIHVKPDQRKSVEQAIAKAVN